MTANADQSVSSPHRVSVNAVSGTVARRGVSLTFRDVHVRAGDKDILKTISGGVERGEMMAVMGPSGAGKTTLLNVLSGRLKKSYSMKGHVEMNGQPLSKRLKRQISYVLQTDVYFTYLTLKQSLTYSALLRLPSSMSTKEKLMMVDHAMEALKIKHCENTIFGNMFVTGLSGGEKKRASIAGELLTDPAILMLDEPTSGLDSSSAQSLLRTVKHLATEEGKTVVATIHQPNTQCYNEFDKLLLLCEGEVAYIGPANYVIEYFDYVGYPCRGYYNPADFILELVTGSDEQIRHIKQSFKERGSHFLSALQNPPLEKPLRSIPEESEPNHVHVAMAPKRASLSRAVDLGGYPMSVLVENGTVGREKVDTVDVYEENDYSKFPTSFWTQFRVLLRRSFHQSRPEILSRLYLIQNLLMAFVVGIVWFRTEREEKNIRDKYGFFFFPTVYWCFNSMFPAALALGQERAIVLKERAAGSYRLSAYFLSKSLSEMPLIIIYPFLYWTVTYWMAGMRAGPEFITSLLILWLNAIAAQSMGLFVGSFVKNARQLITVSSVTLLTAMLLGGFYVVHLPSWITWVSYLSPILFCFSALLNVEFGPGSQPFRCDPVVSAYDVCENVTSIVAQNGSDFLIQGADILKDFNITLLTWQCILALIVLGVALRTATYLVLRFFEKPS